MPGKLDPNNIMEAVRKRRGSALKRSRNQVSSKGVGKGSKGNSVASSSAIRSAKSAIGGPS